MLFSKFIATQKIDYRSEQALEIKFSGTEVTFRLPANKNSAKIPRLPQPNQVIPFGFYDTAFHAKTGKAYRLTPEEYFQDPLTKISHKAAIEIDGEEQQLLCQRRLSRHEFAYQDTLHDEDISCHAGFEIWISRNGQQGNLFDRQNLKCAEVHRLSLEHVYAANERAKKLALREAAAEDKKAKRAAATLAFENNDMPNDLFFDDDDDWDEVEYDMQKSAEQAVAATGYHWALQQFGHHQLLSCLNSSDEEWIFEGVTSQTFLLAISQDHYLRLNFYGNPIHHAFTEAFFRLQKFILSNMHYQPTEIVQHDKEQTAALNTLHNVDGDAFDGKSMIGFQDWLAAAKKAQEKLPNLQQVKQEQRDLAAERTTFTEKINRLLGSSFSATFIALIFITFFSGAYGYYIFASNMLQGQDSPWLAGFLIAIPFIMQGPVDMISARIDKLYERLRDEEM